MEIAVSVVYAPTPSYGNGQPGARRRKINFNVPTHPALHVTSRCVVPAVQVNPLIRHNLVCLSNSPVSLFNHYTTEMYSMYTVEYWFLWDYPK